MTATNHVVTGALITASISNPVISLPLALVSHLLFDAIPHFGVDPEKDFKIFAPALLMDMICASSVLLALLISQPAHYLVIVAGGIVAASPDLLSIPFFVDILRHRPHPFGVVQRFLRRIQWSESILPGLPIEVMWFGINGALLLQRIY